MMGKRDRCPQVLSWKTRLLSNEVNESKMKTEKKVKVTRTDKN